MQDVKKEIELLLITYFRQCYVDFPKGKLVASESPDFIVREKHARNLGIELVRLFPSSSSESLINNTSSELRNEVIENTKELFEGSSGMNLFVKFLFSEKKNILPERVLSLSVFLTNMIRKTVAATSEKSFFFHRFIEKEMSGEVEEMLVVHHPEMSESLWEEANSLGISENVIDDINAMIAKKDEKLFLYKKQQLDEYWLLITSDRLRNTHNSNVANRIFKADFQSGFDRVLLFDLIKSKVFELKMPPSD